VGGGEGVGGGPTCGADHVLPLHHVGVALVELADALARQAAVVELQDVPHLHAHRADLQRAQAVLPVAHGTVAPPHVAPVQHGGDGRLQHGQHEAGVVRAALGFSGRRGFLGDGEEEEEEELK